MAKNQQVAETKQQPPLVVLRNQMEARQNEFANALPAHMPVARFQRVVMTAVQNNPDLLEADRQTFFNSCMKAAQDGLLPDGREGAIVIYNTKVKENGKEIWIKAAQWMPMIFGVLKKIRNSGQLKSIVARVVYEGDQFRYWIDDTGEHLEYEAADNPNRDVIRRVFAMAQTLDGGTYVEVMTVDEVEKVRAVSRAGKSGPWVQWWDQMACKTVLRRLSKRLPMSSDLDDLIRRDDALYDLNGAGDAQQRGPRLRGAAALDALAAGRPLNALPPPADAIDDATVSEPDAGRKANRAGETKGDATNDKGGGAAASQQASDDENGEGDQGDNDFPGDRPSQRGEDDGAADDGDGDDAAEIAALIEEIGETPRGIDTGDVAQVYSFRQGMMAAEKGVARKALPGALRADNRAAEAAAWGAGHDLAIERRRNGREG